RVFHTDDDTGIPSVQLTSFPSIHQHRFYTDQLFDDRSDTILIRAQRMAGYGSMCDIQAMGTDGTHPRIIVRDLDTAVIMSGDERWVHFGRGAVICRASVDGGCEEETVAEIPGATGVFIIDRSPDGDYWFGWAAMEKGSAIFLA
ncbi:MAG: hypothetical protein QGH20_03865, partial [Candidatus Latescibacteria bacterium]|nr:hypothetical protein [Candidatus Latescibacterota bacterium]